MRARVLDKLCKFAWKRKQFYHFWQAQTFWFDGFSRRQHSCATTPPQQLYCHLAFCVCLQKNAALVCLAWKKAYFIKWILEGRFDWGGCWVYKHRNQSQSLRAGEKLITKQNTTFDEVFLKVCVGDCWDRLNPSLMKVLWAAELSWAVSWGSVVSQSVQRDRPPITNHDPG